MLIGIAGYAQSGKDTVASILVRECGFRRIAFADAVKAVLAGVNPWVTSRRRLSDVLAVTDWEGAKQHPEVRRLLQRLGTEAGRKHIHPDVWVQAAMRHVDKGGDWVISDVRFPNEVGAIRERGGRVWRVERPGVEAVNDHISEHAIVGTIWDEVIPNSGTLDDLTQHVLHLETELRKEQP